MQTTAVFRAGAAGPRVGHGDPLGCQRALIMAFGGVTYGVRTFTAAAPRSLAPGCTLRRVSSSAAKLEEATTHGLDSSTIDWRAQWYPVALERDLWKDRPNVVTVLGERLVVWWSPNESRWRCFRDQCPHRLVPLSEGRINPEGTLECPYHGWSFQGDGRCVHIPQGGELTQRRACTVAYACVLKQGMVWVKLVEVQRDRQGRPVGHAEVTEDDEASIPIIPEIEEDRDSWVVFEAHRDLPLDWSTVLENVLDAGHVPYTHHKTISRRERACSMFDLRVTLYADVTSITDHADGEPPPRHHAQEANSAGFQGLWEGGPGDGMYGSQYTRFTAPGFVCHTLDARETRGFLSLTVIYVVPSEPGRCRLITRLPTQLVKGMAAARFVAKALPRWKTHTNVMIPLEDDQVFLHHGEKAYAEQRYGVDSAAIAPAVLQPPAAAAAPKPLGQVFYSPNRMDVFVAALRSWIDKHGGGGPFGPQDRLWLASIGRRWTTTDLMDRYHQHTSSCATCSKALEQVRGLRAKLWAAAAGLLFWAAVCAAVALATPAAGASCAAPGSGTAAVAAAALKAGYWLVMAGDAASTMARAAGLLLASGLALAASQVLSAAEHDLLAGTYPPPRNREP